MEQHEELITRLRIDHAVTQQRLAELATQSSLLREEFRDFREEVKPVIERVQNWRGALSVLMIVSAAIGASLSTLFKKFVGSF